jgi:hypothetical protein
MTPLRPRGYSVIGFSVTLQFLPNPSCIVTDFWRTYVPIASSLPPRCSVTVFVLQTRAPCGQACSNGQTCIHGLPRRPDARRVPSNVWLRFVIFC